MVLIPVSTNSLTDPLLLSSCHRLTAHPWSPAASSSPTQTCSPAQQLHRIKDTLPHSVFALCARKRGESKMPLGFWLGWWGEDSATPWDRNTKEWQGGGLDREAR